MKNLILMLFLFVLFIVSSQENLVPNGNFNATMKNGIGNSLIDSIEIDNTTLPKKLQYGVSINQSLTRYGLPTAVLFTLHYKKHQFDIGPQFRLGKSINTFQKNIGVEFNYRFYITGDTNRFSSYVLLNADYFYQFKRDDRYLASSDPLLNGQKSTQTNIYHNIQLNIGYGIKLKLVGGLYIGSNIGIGLNKEYHSYQNMVLGNIDTYNADDTNLGFIGTILVGYKF